MSNTLFESVSSIVEFTYARTDKISSFLNNVNSKEHKYQFGVILDENRKILATITDGDVRRALLKGYSIADKLEVCGYKKPVTGKIGETAHNTRLLMSIKAATSFLPIAGPEGELTDIIIPIEEKQNEAATLIMAGGFGKRLGPLTKNTPKPLLKIGGKPILSRIIDKIEEANVPNTYVSLHFLPEKITEYLNSYSTKTKFHYIYEDFPLGTAGSISMLPDDVNGPLLVTNADLISAINLSSLLDFHTSNYFDATLVVSNFSQEVPFGVVEYSQDGAFIGCNEKPTMNYPILAGVYCFSKQALTLIRGQEPRYLDMPDFIKLIQKASLSIGVFPLHEEWRDVGSPSEYEVALRAEKSKIQS